MTDRHHKPRRGRGALNNPDNRYGHHTRERTDDGWGSLEHEDNPLRELFRDKTKRIISRNQSPDVPFDQSINPYRGCEHGCIYCFARPTHAYLDHSPGLDFETKLHYKPEAAELLRSELGEKNYRCSPIALGINTDAYQPIERQLGITRAVLEVLAEYHHPVSIVTKSALIERDVDLLERLAGENLVSVMVSITTLDPELARRLEPRAASPARRLQLIRNLTAADIPTGVLMAPLIPFLNDHEINTILEQVRGAGALTSGYVLLRLPLELEGLFSDWLRSHVPDKAERIMNRIRDSRGGKAYDSRFGSRMRGEGVFADLIAQRFRQAMKQLDFPGIPDLDCNRFTPPRETGLQMSLFE